MPIRLCAALLTVAAALALTALPAKAAITSTQITSPSENAVIDLGDLSESAPTFPVTGTANADSVAGDKVDIVCAYGATNTLVTPNLANDVPVDPATHAFTANAVVSSAGTSYYRCRMHAIPSTGFPPSLTPFTGPTVAIDGWEQYRIAGGPNAGKLADFAQFVSAPQGYFSMGAATQCAITDSYLTDPSTLGYTPFFGCGGIDRAPFGSVGFWIDDKVALLPTGVADFDALSPAFLPIESFTHQVDPATGDATITSVEPAVLCTGTTQNCASPSQDAQLRVEHTATTSAEGRLLTVRDRFVNTAGSARRLQVNYRIHLSGSKTIDAPSASERPTPAIVSIVESGGTEGTYTKPHGAIGWSGAGALVVDAGSVYLTNSRTIPPNGSTTITHTYAQALTKATADQLALAPVTAGVPSIAIGTPGQGETLRSAITLVPMTGTVADDGSVAEVRVRGGSIPGFNVKAVVSGTTWSAQVPAADGVNSYVARVTDDEGNIAEATRSFNFVRQFVPPPPRGTPPALPFTLTLGKLKPGATSVSLTGTFVSFGVVEAKLAARVRSKKKTKVVTVGTAKRTLARTGKTTFTVSLNATGRALLAKLKTLKTTLTVIYRPTITSKTTTRNATVTFKAKPKKKRKKPRG